MTSRTTPVGIIVIVLAGLIVMGCSASTTAVFQALLEPDGTAVSSPGATTNADPAVEGDPIETWWPHPDGYAMDLPAGWLGVAVAEGQTEELLTSVAVTMPDLATRIRDYLAGTELRVSAIATDLADEATTAPVLVVLAESANGRRARELKAYVLERITLLPGLVSAPVMHTDRGLNTKAVRYDYSIDDVDLGSLRVRSYLFRFGRQAYLVSFVAPAETADAVDAVFDEIANSLSFGV